MQEPIIDSDLQPQVVEEQTQSSISTFWRYVRDIVETILLAAIMFVGINTVSARVRVDGFSMVPTLNDGQFVLVNKLSYHISSWKHGDIIVFRFPLDPTQDFIKRIIGTPGDHVVIGGGKVSVNNTILNEPYIAASPDYAGEWTVPENSLFVLGDNRNDSSDSHSWGMVPMQNVIGKAILIYWPIKNWNIIDHVTLAVAAP